MVLDAQTRRRRTHDKTSRKSFAGKIGKLGRKTGKPMKENVRKDSHGMMDVDDFWSSSEDEDEYEDLEEEFENERDDFENQLMGGADSSTAPAKTPLGDRTNKRRSSTRSTVKKSSVSRRQSVASVVSVVTAMGANNNVSLSDLDSTLNSTLNSSLNDSANIVDVSTEMEDDDDLDDTIANDRVSSEVVFKQATPKAAAKKSKAAPKKKATPVAKKAPAKKKTTAAKKKATSTVDKKKRLSIHPSAIINNGENEDNENGIRRSGRQRIKPLERWRNERVVYNRRLSALPTVAGVITIPKAPTPKKRRRNPTNTNNSSGGVVKKARTSGDVGPAAVVGEKLPATPGKVVTCAIMDARRQKEARKAIAVPQKAIQMFPVSEEDGAETGTVVGKAIECSRFASGMVRLPAGQVLPNQDPGENTESFHVVQGQVQVKVYKTKFVISAGGFFYVPPHNCYTIANQTKSTEAQLVFTSCKPAGKK